ncbi:DUF4145 domain-containing protein [Croceibacter atlanticus]|uniref:DUF4145 domain-containing protein n=1 Tax=Croceibacter atlanticus TaxID=313588 RepID=UPI0024B88AE3|nr:DUF4145 domain-containing protein [Croceibacter atlanticus]
MKYIQPEVFKNSFTCPHCGVLAKQNWNQRDFNFQSHSTNIGDVKIDRNVIRTSKCDHCQDYSLWILTKMFYPETGSAPFPNPEMPESVKKLYLEAASIMNKSPKGAAALLRLSIQILCKELGEEGKNINTDIKDLVKKGLPEIVQKSLDIVRVTGNDAVHPGQIDTDDIKIVNKLFELINVIIEYMIALPKQVSSLYDTLPESKRDGITKRDQ